MPRTLLSLRGMCTPESFLAARHARCLLGDLPYVLPREEATEHRIVVG